MPAARSISAGAAAGGDRVFEKRRVRGRGTRLERLQELADAQLELGYLMVQVEEPPLVAELTVRSSFHPIQDGAASEIGNAAGPVQRARCPELVEFVLAEAEIYEAVSGSENTHYDSCLAMNTTIRGRRGSHS